MSAELRSLLDDAAGVEFEPVDLEALVGAGERRLRRRRRGAVATVAAVVVLITGLALTVQLLADETPAGKRRSESREVATTGTIEPTPVAWMAGSTLRTQEGSAELEITPVSLVVNRTGFAFRDRAGRVDSLVEGRERTLGRGADGTEEPLVADAVGPWVGWVDRSVTPAAFVVADLRTGKVDRFDGHGGAPDPSGNLWEKGPFFAIDDGVAYWRDDRGVVATDLTSGQQRVLDLPGHEPMAVDVAGGLLTGRVLAAGGRGVLDSRFLGGDVRTVEGAGLRLPVVRGRFLGTLSPSGARVATDTVGNRPLEIIDLATGRATPVEIGVNEASEYRRVTAWLDDDTFVMRDLGPEDGANYTLSVCSALDGQCTLVIAGLPLKSAIADNF